MTIQVLLAEEHQKPVIRNMGLLYAYDLSQYCGHHEIWRLPESGIYEEGFAHLDTYWQDPSRIPYIIRVEGELAGFALINTISPAVNFSIAEFFIMTKHQRQGIGSWVAQYLFRHHQGKWEITVMADNKRGEAFWDKVISLVTKGTFTKELNPDAPFPLYRYIFDIHL